VPRPVVLQAPVAACVQLQHVRSRAHSLTRKQATTRPTSPPFSLSSSCWELR
jgi:hypothetical protein